MKIENYFVKSEIDLSKYQGNQIGGRLNKNNLEESTQLVLFSFGKEKAENYQKLREELYRLSYGNWQIEMIDLGHFDALDNSREKLKDCFEYFQGNQIKMIVISEDNSLLYQAYENFDSTKLVANISIIDPKISLSTKVGKEELNPHNLLNHLKFNKPNRLDNYYHLSYLSFYLSQEKKDLLEKLNIQIKRLGDIHYDVTEVEPELRMSHLIGFGLSSIKYTDAPRSNKVEVNGLSSYQSCAITRYSGLSEENNFFNIYDYNPKDSLENLTEQTVSQLIWYYIEGLNQRKIEKADLESQHFQKYIVPMNTEQPVVFHKSLKTKKWWIEVSETLEENQKYIHACTYSDYLNAVNGEIPERYWRNFKKYF